MDKLITKLYKNNIIVFKNITLKNGLVSPIWVNLLKLFEDKYLLNIFLEELNEYIVNNISFEHIYGIDTLCKHFATLLYYKYNYSNIFDKNTHNDNVIILKENYGFTRTNTLKIKNQNIICIFFLVKYGNIKNIDYPNYCFLDNINILSILYQKRILNHEKYFDYFKILNEIKDSDNSIKKIKNIELKSHLIFDTIHIEKLDIKDFIKTLDFICPHISLIKINLNAFVKNLSSVVKLLIFHNIIIIDYFNKENLEIIENICRSLNKNFNNYVINLLNIEDLLKPQSFNMDYLIIDNIILPEFDNVRISILNKTNKNYFILGMITKKEEYIYENKLKIGYYDNGESLEKKILTLNYNLLITNNAKNIVNLKQLINIIMKS